MQSQVYITLLTAFSGIILGFLLTQVGNYLQSYREDKRVLKQVLFNQLDIWVEMKKADVETLVPLLIEKFRAALLKRGAQADQVDNMMSVPLAPLITLIKSLKLASPENLKDRYQESVNQLAKVDPLLAYQLSGKPQTDFNEVIDTFIGRTVEFEGKKIEEVSSDQTISFFTSFIREYSQQKILSGMEKDILAVAGRISYLTRFRTRRRLNELTLKLSEGAEDYIGKFLDSLTQHIVQNPIPVDSTKEPLTGSSEFTD